MLESFNAMHLHKPSVEFTPTKLTENEKEELKIMYQSGKYSIKEMSEWFGVSRHTIMKEINNFGGKK